MIIDALEAFARPLFERSPLLRLGSPCRGLTPPSSKPLLGRYTVIFAVARTVGWVSQWKEMIAENPASIKITRPRQVG